MQSFTLSLNKLEAKAVKACLMSIVKAGSAREAEWKPHDLNYKVLQVNKQLLKRIETAEAAFEKDNALLWHKLELNRVDIKVMLETLKHTASLQETVLKEYAIRPENHKAFADEPGRRKEDYVSRLTDRNKECLAIIAKVEGVLNSANAIT